MINRNQAFIKALHKVFKDFGVRIEEYGSYADESYKCYFEGDDVNVLIEPNIFEGYDLTPDPEPPPPPPVIVEKIVEREVITKINVHKATLDALKEIKNFYNRKDKLLSARKAYCMYDIARKALKVVE